jgi:tetratricopeptide (TPR) repeat protein
VLHSKWNGNELVVATLPSAPHRIPQTVLSELEPDSSFIDTNAPKVALRKEQFSSTRQSPDKDNPNSNIVLTCSYFSSEADPRAAYGSMCEATDVNFNNPDFYFRKAKILIQLENWGKAMQTLKGCIVDDPNKAEYYLARAYCYHKLRMEALAQADLRTAKFKNPTLPAVIEFGDE